MIDLRTVPSDQAAIISPAGSPATTGGSAASAAIAAFRSVSGSASTAVKVGPICRQRETALAGLLLCFAWLAWPAQRQGAEK